MVDNLNDIQARITDPTTGNPALGSRVSAVESGKVPTTRTVSTANGLQGGGDLSANRTISPVYGTAANTIAQGNDSRITITQDATKGNNALDTRVAALETRTGTERNSTAATALNNGAQVDVPFENSVRSSSDVTYASSIFTIVNAGVYAIESTVRMTAPAGTLELNLWVSTDGGSTWRRKSGWLGGLMGTVSTTIRLAAGNKVKVTALNTSGSNRTIETAAEETTHISLYRTGG
ncbi:hypothetical protein [Amycolatopsis orientalis]|uniref:hypothetical protein n=1 Tax=Amycolatopsis orientalis TaxID=31958 RepID=UPI00131A0625|nr:hypothetical protein [Amycolatopsis orientalis]